MLSKLKTQIFYVQVRENAFTVRCVRTGKSVVLDAPFSSKRLVIAEFSVAERLLREGFGQLRDSWLSPIAVMHPLELTDEKLSEVESNILRELALSAGARDAKPWVGRALRDEELGDAASVAAL